MLTSSFTTTAWSASRLMSQQIWWESVSKPILPNALIKLRVNIESAVSRLSWADSTPRFALRKFHNMQMQLSLAKRKRSGNRSCKTLNTAGCKLTIALPHVHLWQTFGQIAPSTKEKIISQSGSWRRGGAAISYATFALCKRFSIILKHVAPWMIFLQNLKRCVINHSSFLWTITSPQTWIKQKHSFVSWRNSRSVG